MFAFPTPQQAGPSHYLHFQTSVLPVELWLPCPASFLNVPPLFDANARRRTKHYWRKIECTFHPKNLNQKIISVKQCSSLSSLLLFDRNLEILCTWSPCGAKITLGALFSSNSSFSFLTLIFPPAVPLEVEAVGRLSFPGVPDRRRVRMLSACFCSARLYAVLLDSSFEPEAGSTLSSSSSFLIFAFPRLVDPLLLLRAPFCKKSTGLLPRSSQSSLDPRPPAHNKIFPLHTCSTLSIKYKIYVPPSASSSDKSILVWLNKSGIKCFNNCLIFRLSSFWIPLWRRTWCRSRFVASSNMARSTYWKVKWGPDNECSKSPFSWSWR